MISRTWNLQGKSKKLLMACQRYFDEYSEFITLKQLFYLLVEEGLVENNDTGWRKLKALTLRARKHGRISPTAFSLNRYPTTTQYAVKPDEYLAKAVKDYRIPRTYGQDNYFEIWVEREPLNVFVENLLGEYDIPVFVTGGFSNYAFTYSAAERIRDSLHREGSPRVLYLADFGVSSTKMFETISEELSFELGLTRQEVGSILFKGAILPEHVIKYHLPACYAKSKGAQSRRYDELYRDLLPLMGLGPDQYVEIEALNPKVLSEIIHNVMFGLISQDTLADVAMEEADALQELKRLVSGEE